MLYLAALLKDWVASLERANKAAIMRKQRKKKRIQKRGMLTKAEGEELIT